MLENGVVHRNGETALENDRKHMHASTLTPRALVAKCTTSEPMRVGETLGKSPLPICSRLSSEVFPTAACEIETNGFIGTILIQ